MQMTLKFSIRLKKGLQVPTSLQNKRSQMGRCGYYDNLSVKATSRASMDIKTETAITILTQNFRNYILLQITPLLQTKRKNFFLKPRPVALRISST